MKHPYLRPTIKVLVHKTLIAHKVHNHLTSTVFTGSNRKKTYSAQSPVEPHLNMSSRPSRPNTKSLIIALADAALSISARTKTLRINLGFSNESGVGFIRFSFLRHRLQINSQSDFGCVIKPLIMSRLIAGHSRRILA